jgi:hypothetical protein
MVWGRTAADQGAALAFFSVKHYVFNIMCKQLCLKHDGKLLLSISYGCPEPLWVKFDRLSRSNLVKPAHLKTFCTGRLPAQGTTIRRTKSWRRMYIQSKIGRPVSLRCRIKTAGFEQNRPEI